MKIRRILVIAALSLVAVLPAQAKKEQAKYVFYLIGDGMGINHVRGAEIYNQATGSGPEEINFFHFPVRTFVNTHSSSSLVTDSAAGGTALATGFRTYNDGMGVDPDGNPVSNLTEWAHAAGYGAGVATSVGVNHATPAAFYAHTKSRSEYETIAEQLIAADNISFAAGSGFINQEKKTGHSSQYLEQKAKDAGIAVYHGKQQFGDLAKHKGRVICLSVDPKEEEELKYSIDQKPGDTKLADFVEAGIDYLYGHFAKKGFFFMIEGGMIDHAGHNDDGAADFQEVNDFAEAIDLVLAFYNQHPDETLIVITADHETGGLMLGSGQYEMNPVRMSATAKSEVELNEAYRQFIASAGPRKTPSWDDMKLWLKQNIGLWDTIAVDSRTERELWETYDRSVRPGGAQVVSLYSSSTQIVSDALMYANKASGFSWAHGAHTGSPVGLYVKGVGSTRFLECQNNVDIPVMIAKIANYK